LQFLLLFLQGLINLENIKQKSTIFPPLFMMRKIPFETIIKNQLKIHPGFEIRDLYKLIFQISFGPHHFVKDRKGVYFILKREISISENPFKNEKLIELIDPDMRVVRINLRPYKLLGGSLKKLAEIFIDSTKIIKGDPNKMIRLFKEALKLSKLGKIDFDPVEMENFFNLMISRNFPPVEHSKRYI